MVLGFYTAGVRIYGLLVRLVSWRSSKARLWVAGRRGWLAAIGRQDLAGCVWFHCSSVGEFEQARPVIEKLRSERPDLRLLLTFFSPSGYELHKRYAEVDHVAYLPLDTPGNMRAWLDAVQPALVVFTKYDFWFNLMQLLDARSVPMVAISVHLPPDHWFFKWPGSLLRSRLAQFSAIFVQDEGTAARLEDLNISWVEVAGDTRVDRVLANTVDALDLPALQVFAQRAPTVVAGSIWPPDSEVLLTVAEKLPDLQWVVAPHEVGRGMEEAWKKAFGDAFYHWKDRNTLPVLEAHHRVVFVDFVGLLSKLYRFGKVAYVGGGFTSGIHNILEPAAYGIPVIFGPKHARFREAAMLREAGIGFAVAGADECVAQLKRQAGDEEQDVRGKAKVFFDRHRGASAAILQWLLPRLEQ